MKKRNLVVANWKMNPKSPEEAKKIFNSTRNFAKKYKNVDVVVCPPFIYLDLLSRLNRPKNLILGAQNISTEEKGAFTGEISAPMLKNVGAKYSIIGHSERRAMGEDGNLIRKKMEMAFLNGITPILCIGENERDKDGSHLEVIKNQIKESLSGLQKRNLLGLLIAYEPVWAIGKSYREAMSPTDAHEAVLFIKKVSGEIFGRDVGDSLQVLYGAAIEAPNAKAMIDYGNVSGFLVGHASLEPEQFGKILEAVNFK
ncbi:MAG TPA: triose-phosphate isomerase [Candidatus Paceibacterota bacterium]